MGIPGLRGSESFTVQIHIQTHASCVMWVKIMSYGSADATNNVAGYWWLVNRLQQAKAHVNSALHVIGDSALVISQY